MTIIDKIEQAELDFYRTTGKAPHNVYIGIADAEELKAVVDKNAVVYMNQQLRRLQVMGLIVYTVDEQHHLAVS